MNELEQFRQCLELWAWLGAIMPPWFGKHKTIPVDDPNRPGEIPISLDTRPIPFWNGVNPWSAIQTNEPKFPTETIALDHYAAIGFPALWAGSGHIWLGFGDITKTILYHSPATMPE